MFKVTLYKMKICLQFSIDEICQILSVYENEELKRNWLMENKSNVNKDLCIN